MDKNNKVSAFFHHQWSHIIVEKMLFSMISPVPKPRICKRRRIPGDRDGPWRRHRTSPTPEIRNFIYWHDWCITICMDIGLSTTNFTAFLVHLPIALAYKIEIEEKYSVFFCLWNNQMAHKIQIEIFHERVGSRDMSLPGPVSES